MEAVYTREDWFSLEGRDIYWRGIIVPYFGSNPIKVLEIGSFEGRSLRWMFENLNVEFAYSIDTAHKSNFFGNLEPWDKKLSILRGKSQIIIREITEELDLIYVDGNHRAHACLEDCVLSFRTLKVGGIMVMDDYIWREDLYKKDSRRTPKKAIDAFIDCYHHFIEVLHVGHQVFVKKIKEI